MKRNHPKFSEYKNP